MSPITHPGMVWIISGIFCLIYSIVGFFGWFMPGVADLVKFAQSFEMWQLYTAGGLALFFEGLYAVGNFIPGSTFAIIIAIIALAHSKTAFIFTILALFVGWVIAGIINIYITSHILSRRDIPELKDIKAHDRLLTTWYPVFRSSYEVAQVVAGTKPWRVLISSIKVKFVATLCAAIYAIILPHVVDIYNMTNEEGFGLAFVIAFICLGVGAWLIKTDKRKLSTEK